MIVIKLTKKNLNEVIDLAASRLAAGRTIVYPTETFYGLGCSANCKPAIKKIYQIKGREKNKPLPFLLGDLKMARKYCKLKPLAKKLSVKYWPGPLSLVLQTNRTGKKFFGQADVGVRISSLQLATDLVKAIGYPLVSTSANPAGKPPAMDAGSAIKYFLRRRHKPDLIIDAGRLRRSKGSTFVDLTGKQPIILREGDTKIKI